MQFSLHRLAIFAIVIFSSKLFANSNYEQNLIGIWAMAPILNPPSGVERGVANVTQYNQDGSYHLFDYTCIASGKFKRNPSGDDIGRWNIDGDRIITFSGNPKELKQLEIDSEKLRNELATMSYEERKIRIQSAPRNLVEFMENAHLVGVEIITSLVGDVLRSKQEFSEGYFLYFTSLKVDSVKPNCEKFK